MLIDAQETLGVSEDEAFILMAHWNWSKQRLLDRWFENEIQTRMEAGLTPNDSAVDFKQTKGVKLGAVKLIRDILSNKEVCPICWTNPCEDTLQCQHVVCGQCWRSYIH